MILDVAVTGVDLFGRVAYDDPYKPLEARRQPEWITTRQIHGEVKRIIKYQIRLQLTFTEREAKSSKVELVFRWWSKCISSVTSRTASRNILFSSARISNT